MSNSYFFKYSQNNIFKDKAQPDLGNDNNDNNWEAHCEELSKVLKTDIVPATSDKQPLPIIPCAMYNDILPVVSGVAVSYPHPFKQLRTIIRLKKGCVTFADRRLVNTPCWTEELITVDNVEQVEHEHCEAIRVLPDNVDEHMQPGYNCWSDITAIETPKFRVCFGKVLLCDYCAYSAFFNVFHQYIKFLLRSYDKIYVCSGSLYLDDVREENRSRRASHFFKVILCQDGSGNYRFECYKVENKRLRNVRGQYMDLKRYVISRRQLENETGVDMFAHVYGDRIVAEETSNNFSPECGLDSSVDSSEEENNTSVDVEHVDTPEEIFEGDAKDARITKHPNIGSRSILRYWDYVIHADKFARSVCWTHQVITEANVAQVEHRHCEKAKLMYLEKDEDDRLNVISVLRPSSPRLNEYSVLECHHCKYRNFWKVFHQYVTFLTKKYAIVNVDSGAIYSAEDNVKHRGFCSFETHSFKAVKCNNKDGTFRIECYVIPDEPMNEECYDLNDFLVFRNELLQYSGIMVFEDVNEDQIRDCEPDRNFQPYPIEVQRFYDISDISS